MARALGATSRQLANASLASSCCSLVARRSFATAEQAVKSKPGKRRWLLWGSSVAVAGGAGFVSYVSYGSYKRKVATHEKIRRIEEKPVPARRECIQRLQSGEEFDVLVVGGGATGAGIALEAQLRGLNVACVEQEDFGSGTSSKSTKLLWAGSRYLVLALTKLFHPAALLNPLGAWEQFMGTWKMVMHCVEERTYMLETNPHLTNWVPVAVPMDKWVIWPPPFGYWPAALGPMTGTFVIFFKFYDALSNWSAPGSYVMSARRAREEFPQMDADRMKYVVVFYEGAHNDARTNLSIAMTAAQHGACVSNYAQVEGIVFDDKGKAVGAKIRDRAVDKAETFEVRAKKIIYAGGPFTDGLRQLSEGETVKPVVNGSGGTHIVLPPYYCPRHLGMVDMSTSRGSFLFFLPWEGYTLVGTTDVKTKPDLHHEVPEDEIQYLVNECEKYLSPSLRVRRRDVMSAWYGIRPLAADPNASGQSSLSRDHVISYNKDNDITFVSGGKWTTWREMAEDAVDQVVRRDSVLKAKAGPSTSLQTPLVGTGKTNFYPEGWNESLSIKLSQSYDVAYDIAQHLVRNYGTRAAEVLEYAPPESVRGSRSGLYKHYPRLYEGAAATTGYPYLEAEVLYAMDKEYAVSPVDILARRTRLAFLNSTAARLALPRVVELMGDKLGWDEARRREEYEKADLLLHQDFAGPVANKANASLRAACAADVKATFDHIDTKKRGTLSREGIEIASKELGFPLQGEELDKAMKDMDHHKTGQITFPEFLAWWNSSDESEAFRSKLQRDRASGFYTKDR
mmetsp:Transcript_90073/g.197264  ORF Transcript_90073/g.197264 Transcript_90073/m.197264 type:complete len:794 (-) Transcript_90073:148-2529(-)